ncbi:hypothetical protein Leryth_025665, partial [Lithospermum erythrorhizon]
MLTCCMSRSSPDASPNPFDVRDLLRSELRVLQKMDSVREMTSKFVKPERFDTHFLWTYLKVAYFLKHHKHKNKMT